MKLLIQSPIVFREEDHTYWLNGKQLQGITQTLIHRAFPNKYNGIDQEVLANAARKGKELHQLIEFHDNFNTASEEHADPRIANYEKLKQQYGLHTIANEYIVSDEENYATAIDLVMEADDEVVLVDIKTTYELDKASTGLQLSINKRFFEMQNPDLKVSRIAVLWLPNKDTSIAELHFLSIVDDETLDALIAADLADEPFEFNPVPEGWDFLELQYLALNEKKEELENEIAEIKEEMMKVLIDKNLSSVKTGSTTISYIPAKTSKRFDSAAFKKAQPDLYNNYMKESETAATIRILKK